MVIEDAAVYREGEENDWDLGCGKEDLESGGYRWGENRLDDDEMEAKE